MKTKLLIALIFIFFVYVAKGDVPLLAIKLNNDSPVQYCTVPVIVAGNLTIEGTFAITGMFVSFTQGFISAEDELVYSGAISSIKGTWDQTKGVLHLVQNGSVTPTNKNYEDAIKEVIYKNNNKTVPTLGLRKISITLDDADYLDETTHFYQFISAPGIYWKDARDKAASTFYHGVLRGYLATITSQKENDFINLRTNLAGWIGASDDAKEGDWRWVTGPEGLEAGGLGRLFWRGTGAQAKAAQANNDPNFGPVLDGNGVPYYQNWNSANSEPNNAGNENFAHITVFTTPGMISQSHTWNDLINNGNGPGSDYYPAGYLIEFGGMEPYTLNLSATLDLLVNTISFNTKPILPICEGQSVTLNQPDNTNPAVSYSWTNANGTVATLSDAGAANPLATPLITTKYTVNANRNGRCPISLDFKVTVNPNPIIDLSVDSKTCYGYNLEVLDKGDVNAANSTFTWTFGGNTIISGLGISNTTIPLGLDQSNRDLTLLVVSQNNCSNQTTVSNILVKPALSPFTVKDPILCLSDSFEFSVTPDPSVITYEWNFGDGKLGSGLNPTHNYQQSKKYDIQLTVTNKDNCNNTAVIKDMVFAAPVPVAAFSMSDSIIYTNKPNVSLLDASSLASGWYWDFGDSLTSKLQNPVHDYKGAGRRTVWLKVTSDFNCVDSLSHQLLIAFDRIFPPNGFSPNAPNAIDRVFLLNSVGINSAGYHFVVLSRWNDIVFEVKDEIKGWDGRMKDGTFVPVGSYLWVLNYNDFLDHKHGQTGTVTVVY